MINWTDFFYFFISGASLLLSVLGLWFTIIMPGNDPWSKRFFQSFFTVLLISCFFGLAEMVMQQYHVPSTIFSSILFLESIFLSLTQPMLTVCLLHNCGESLRSSRLFHTVLILWVIFFFLTVSSVFIGDFYHVTPDLRYFRGRFYPLVLLPMAIIMLFNLAGTIKRRNLLSHKTFLSFIIAMLPITAALIAQMFFEVYPLIDISITLSALSMYTLIQSDQIEQDLSRQREIARQQREIADQRASIMVLQMRPHFIFNTMTSIYCLSKQDPEKARQVVLDFTSYLRKNFTAVASSEPIPFTDELEHVRAYLAVEQAQYEDSLIVDFDTPHTWFRIPPLTLQPIVENAVKHGRDPYAGPLHISIRTRKTDTGSEIIAADNGRGFTHTDNSEPHIALKNIQQRLEIMCSGSLTVTSNNGSGTVVTVTIPDSAAK